MALSLRVRHHILRVADPDPPYAAGTSDLGTPLAGAGSVLAWISDFSEFHGSDQAAGLYPVYQILTGTKFLGNYWDGDSVLTGLRQALFGSGAAARRPRRRPARRSAPSASSTGSGHSSPSQRSPPCGTRGSPTRPS